VKLIPMSRLHGGFSVHCSHTLSRRSSIKQGQIFFLSFCCSVSYLSTVCVIFTDDVLPRNLSSVLHPDTNTYLHDTLSYWPFNETYHLSKFEDFDHTHFDGKFHLSSYDV